MLEGLPRLDPDHLRRWIAGSLGDERHLLGHGYQGQVFLYRDHEPPLVIKAALGRGPAGGVRRWMLGKEYRIYRRLKGLPGIPRCFGLLDGRFLVLEFVEGVPFRRARIADREGFFGELRDLLGRLHDRDVAHSDLKRKDNLLVVSGRHPCLIDFGAAIARKRGFAPLNHYLYRLAVRFDDNACIKLEVGHTPGEEEAAATGYRRTGVERIAGWIKERWRRLRGLPPRRRSG